MDFLMDWKLYLFILTVLGIAFNFFSHVKLTTNDLKHVSDDLKEIKSEQKCMKDKLITLSEDVANLKGKVL